MISNSFDFHESLKVVLKLPWNKVYGVMYSFHDIINKILSRESNYIVDVVMWQKFNSSSISMREVIITSTL